MGESSSKGKHRSHGPNKDSSRKDASDKSSPTKIPIRSTGGSQGSSSGVQPPISFLFIVSELEFDSEGITNDRWGNPVPPTNPNYYVREHPGRHVFRYRDGRVSVAHGYRWQRGDSGYGLGNGRIWNDSGPLDVYQERSVFNCGPYLPRIVSATDVSSNYVFDPDNPRAHPGHDDDYLFHEGRFFSLMFTGHNGISRAGQSYSRHVFGLGAPWIPSLVPETYTPPPSISAGLRPSRGLGGDTGTVIGLMALSGTLNHPYEVFRQEVWQERRWNGARVQVTQPAYNGCRGVLVHIAYDDQCGVGNDIMYDLIFDFEQTGRFIRDRD